MQTQTQTVKEKVESLAENILNTTTEAAHNLVNEAQSATGKAGSQLADWGDRYGDKAAALWAVGGKRVRNTVLARPYWSLALVIGVSAVTIYLLTRRNNVQTKPRLSAQDRLQHGIESHRNRKAAYTS